MRDITILNETATTDITILNETATYTKFKNRHRTSSYAAVELGLKSAFPPSNRHIDYIILFLIAARAQKTQSVSEDAHTRSSQSSAL